MDEKLLQRYLKVKALADAGSDGEKGAARGVLSRMLEQNPGLGEAASAYQAKQAAHQRERQKAASSQAAPRGFPQKGNWEEIFRYAAGFYQTVQGVVEDVTEAYYGRSLAEDTVDWTAGNRSAAVFIRARIPFDTVKEVRQLNAAQKEAFRQALHTSLDTYVDSLLADPGGR